MALIKKNDLIKKGLEALEDAKRSLATGEHREAELEIRVASTYAQLAQTLGDNSIATQRAVMNW